MRKKIFLSSMIAVLAFAVTSCDDGGSLVKNNGDTDTPMGSNSLVGRWYEVGSDDIRGTIVVFTDTTVTAWFYRNNYVDEDGAVGNWEGKWLNNARYLLNGDTLQLLEFNADEWHLFHSSLIFKTHFEFRSNDTLEIERFVHTMVGYARIKLYKEVQQ
ncbi:MAG: hypothetical protein LBU70_00420 [Chitinispirillales bacterium]|nr:hypothetical protein [Chitinispirillales bacterium]